MTPLVQTLLVILFCLIIFIVVMHVKLANYKKRNPKKAIPISETPDQVIPCDHEWSSPYDYDTYPKSVHIKDSVCIRCGKRAMGSCQ